MRPGRAGGQMRRKAVLVGGRQWRGANRQHGEGSEWQVVGGCSVAGAWWRAGRAVGCSGRCPLPCQMRSKMQHGVPKRGAPAHTLLAQPPQRPPAHNVSQQAAKSRREEGEQRAQKICHFVIVMGRATAQ